MSHAIRHFLASELYRCISAGADNTVHAFALCLVLAIDRLALCASCSIMLGNYDCSHKQLGSDS